MLNTFYSGGGLEIILTPIIHDRPTPCAVSNWFSIF